MLPYFDCNATTIIELEVLEIVTHFLKNEYGNAGSRTHIYGSNAQKAVHVARKQVADVVECETNEVVFTSGATESDNIAILGLAEHGRQNGKMHIITTPIEHKAILEPIEFLKSNGFQVDFIDVDESGRIDIAHLVNLVNPKTLLVSIMHVNNETGIIQPISEVSDILANFEAFLHVDAAQGFGKELTQLTNRRIDLISISGHKIFAPKGIGALIARKRGYKRPPLSPILYGGGQELGLRPGTHPVALIAGLGLAAKISVRDIHSRIAKCNEIGANLRAALKPLRPLSNGDPSNLIHSTLNVSLPGIDSESGMIALKDIMAISNGAACTSNDYTESHVLKAMGLSKERINQALRFSWSHLSTEPSWSEVTKQLSILK